MLTRREFVGGLMLAAYAIAIGYDALTLSEGEREDLEWAELERVEHEHEGGIEQ